MSLSIVFKCDEISKILFKEEWQLSATICMESRIGAAILIQSCGHTSLSFDISISITRSKFSSGRESEHKFNMTLTLDEELQAKMIDQSNSQPYEGFHY